MPTIPSSELQKLLQQMIRIESINPSLDPEGSGESILADFLGDFMEKAGFEVHYQEFLPGRKNVIGILKGKGGGKSLLLNGHLDTVGTIGMKIDPFDPKFEDGKVYGRGSMDMKSGVAAMIMAVKSIRDAGIELSGDVLLACVGDEEYSSKGTEEIIKKFKADAAIVTEPTDMAVTIAHKGFVWTKILVHGKAAHGSRPEVGIDAILKAGTVLQELSIWEHEELPKRKHPLLGRPSLHASIIKGGTEISVYPHLCEIEVEWRTLPGENAAFVNQQLSEVLDRARKKDSALCVEHEVLFERVPLEIAPQSLIVHILDQVVAARGNTDMAHAGIAFWTDAALLADAGIPSVIFGPKGKGLHGAVEYVEFDSVQETAQILAQTIQDFCK